MAYCGQFICIPPRWVSVKKLFFDSILVGFELTITRTGKKIIYYAQTFQIEPSLRSNSVVSQSFDFSTLESFVDTHFSSENELKFAVTHWALDKEKFSHLYKFFCPFGIFLLETCSDFPVYEFEIRKVQHVPAVSNPQDLEPFNLAATSVANDPLFISFVKKKLLNEKRFDLLTKLQALDLSNKRVGRATGWGIPSAQFNCSFDPQSSCELYNNEQIFPTGLFYKAYDFYTLEATEMVGDWYLQVGTFHDNETQTSGNAFVKDYMRIKLETSNITVSVPFTGNLYLVCVGGARSNLKVKLTSPMLTSNKRSKITGQSHMNPLDGYGINVKPDEYVDFGNDKIWFSLPAKYLIADYITKILPTLELAISSTFELKRKPQTRPIYIVCGGISGFGFLHAAYPIMARIAFAEKYLGNTSSNLLTIVGLIVHELAHNLDPPCLPRFLIEITNEIYGLYALQKVCDFLDLQHYHGIDDNTKTCHYEFTEQDHIEFAKEIFGANSVQEKQTLFKSVSRRARFSYHKGVSMFFILVKIFGWTNMSKFMETTAAWKTHSFETSGHLDEYLTEFAKTVDCDLSAFYEKFGFNIRLDSKNFSTHLISELNQSGFCFNVMDSKTLVQKQVWVFRNVDTSLSSTRNSKPNVDSDKFNP